MGRITQASTYIYAYMVNWDGNTNYSCLFPDRINAQVNHIKVQKLILDNHKTISWNKLYSQRHWAVRQQMATGIHNLVWIESKNQKIKPVQSAAIILLAEKKRTIDPDNICAKLYIDGLKENKIIPDDTPTYIYSVVTQSIKSNRDCLTIIIAEPI